MNELTIADIIALIKVIDDRIEEADNYYNGPTKAELKALKAKLNAMI